MIPIEVLGASLINFTAKNPNRGRLREYLERRRNFVG
jgi:hypothetical protein